MNSLGSERSSHMEDGLIFNMIMRAQGWLARAFDETMTTKEVSSLFTICLICILKRPKFLRMAAVNRRDE